MSMLIFTGFADCEVTSTCISKIPPLQIHNSMFVCRLKGLRPRVDHQCFHRQIFRKHTERADALSTIYKISCATTVTSRAPCATASSMVVAVLSLIWVLVGAGVRARQPHVVEHRCRSFAHLPAATESQLTALLSTWAFLAKMCTVGVGSVVYTRPWMPTLLGKMMRRRSIHDA